jgi:hypothetical protein
MNILDVLFNFHYHYWRKIPIKHREKEEQSARSDAAGKAR